VKIAVIDYGSGNLHSAAKAIERAAGERGLKAAVLVTGQAEDVVKADRIVLPGVGAFGDCRRGLDAIPGMVAALEEAVLARGRPFLGICVGMQLMATRGLEHGEHPGLDWIKGEVIKLTADSRQPTAKIPHMGWNELHDIKAHPVLSGIYEGAHAYFVHSYHFRAHDPQTRLATTDYGGPITAVIGRDNIVGTQFHPEKSQAIGIELIGNFLQWRP
jgi:glutamine amidotransferase